MARDYSILKFQILPDTHPILRMKAEPIITFDKDLKDTINRMLFTMDADGGVGLAAPQIGKSIRVLVMRPGIIARDDGSKMEDWIAQYYINPKLMSKTGSTIEIEGCLSSKGKQYRVKRAESISFEYQDLYGERKFKTLQGWPARIFQHELDHLDGILISDIGEEING